MMFQRIWLRGTVLVRCQPILNQSKLKKFMSSRIMERNYFKSSFVNTDFVAAIELRSPNYKPNLQPK